MSKDRPIAYEPHPVSAARKAELVAKGFQIVDAIYQPKGESATAAPTSDDDGDAPGDLTKAELQKLLADSGIAFPANAKKADLVALLEEAQK